MGCKDRDFEPDQADLDRAAAREAKAAHLTALRQRAEETWRRFVDQGLPGVTQQELDDHYGRIVEDAADCKRIADLKKEIEQLILIRAELRAQCIHLTSEGRSAFQDADRYACALCGTIR